MQNWTIYYNPKCGTCRNALEILKKKGISPTVIEYLKNPPSVKELDGLLKKLGLQPKEVVREKENIFQELKLSQKNLRRNDWLRIINENPILLQRPIVENESKAVIARPAEMVEKLFE